MATITGLTAERMREIEAASIVDGTIDSNGHLILTKYDGSSIDAGSALVAIPQGGTVQFLDSTYDKDTPPGSYPDGVSLLWIDGSTNATTWPTFAGKWGSIVTVNYTSAQSDADTHQTWTSLGGLNTTPAQWVRVGNANSGWSPWKKLALKDEVDVVDNRLKVIEGARTLAANSVASTADTSAYPSGTSLLDISSSTDTGWPSANGLVVTQNRSSARCDQTFYINGVGTTGKLRMWVRNYHSTNPGWSPWFQIALVESDFLTRSGTLTAGTWYRIATLPGVQNSIPAKATADFTIVTGGSGQHSTLRLTAGYAYNDRTGNTLMLRDFSGYSNGMGPPFTQARFVPAGSTYDPVHLELKAATVPSDFTVSVKIDHVESNFGSTYYLSKWGLVNFTANGTAENDWHSVGLYWTGRWTAVTLQNNWVNYGTPYAWAEFMMLPGSLLKMRGLVQNGTASSTIGVLPAGCRTKNQLLYITAGGSNTLGRVDVYTDGRVGHVIGTTSYISLDPVHYKAEW